ncbi:MAG: phage holin family protein [Candidatus Doudnabacteria bacterium]|nr:phage holin family protein [Candidatus Doudnabacteria bacterium]
MKILLHWLLATLAIIITAFLLPGVSLTGVFPALVAAVILGILNVFLRPILIILTLPINIFTLGLFTLVLNALLVMLAAAIVPGFAVASFWSALLFGVVLFFMNWALGVSRK